MAKTVEDVNATPFRKAGSGAIAVGEDGRVHKMVKRTVKAGVKRLDPNPYTGLPARKIDGELVVTPHNNTR